MPYLKFTEADQSHFNTIDTKPKKREGQTLLSGLILNPPDRMVQLPKLPQVGKNLMHKEEYTSNFKPQINKQENDDDWSNRKPAAQGSESKEKLDKPDKRQKLIELIKQANSSQGAEGQPGSTLLMFIQTLNKLGTTKGSP